MKSKVANRPDQLDPNKPAEKDTEKELEAKRKRAREGIVIQPSPGGSDPDVRFDKPN